MHFAVAGTGARVKVTKPDLTDLDPERGLPRSMIFNATLNNVLSLVLTANVKGLEPLLPKSNLPGDYKVQQELFHIVGRFHNVTLVDSVIQGLVPLYALVYNDGSETVQRRVEV